MQLSWKRGKFMLSPHIKCICREVNLFNLSLILMLNNTRKYIKEKNREREKPEKMKISTNN